MKRSKFSESQIAFILRQAEEGTAIAEVCRQAGISEATFYNWRHKGNPLSPVVMGLCRLLVYVVAAYAVAQSPPVAVWWAAVLLLCYLIGLTYVAKQETLGVVRNLWPLGFLALPLAYAALAAGNGLASALLFVALTGWVVYALHFLWRRRPGDVPRAVVSLIAGISLLDAVFIAAFGNALLACFAVAVCGTKSRFTQVMRSPAATSSRSGTNFMSSITTS